MRETIVSLRDRRHSAPRLSVAQTYAETRRISRGHAEQELSETRADSLFGRLHAYVEACFRAGRQDLLWKKLTPILERVNNRPAPTYGPRLLRDVATAEAAELQVRQDMLLEGQRDFDAEIRTLDRVILAASTLRESLRAQRVCR